MSVIDFRDSLCKFKKEKIYNFLKEYNINTLQSDLGCVSVEYFNIQQVSIKFIYFRVLNIELFNISDCKC